MKRLILVGLVAAALAGLYTAHETRALRIIPGSKPYVSTYADATGGLRAELAIGDGQAFGALAQDPTLARPDVFVDGKSEAAYRFQRPVLGYLAWIASAGQPQWEPGAQAVLVAIAAGVAVAACGELLRRRGRPPELALLILATPGMLSSVSGMTGEPLALAFFTLGLLAWWAPSRRNGLATLCFVLAVLSRESSLVGVAALLIVEVDAMRRARQGVWTRRLAPLLVPVGAYVGWVLLLRARVGAWPVAGRSSRLSAIPFGGLVQEMSKFADPRRTWFWLVVGLAFVIVAVARRARDPLAFIVVAYAVFAAVLGDAVWFRWQDFGRPLLPLYAYAWIVALTWVTGSNPESEGTPVERGASAQFVSPSEVT